MFDFKGITHITSNPKGHAPGYNFSLVGSVPACLLEPRKATQSDVMGGRAKKAEDGSLIAYHGRKWETVSEILEEAAKFSHVNLCRDPKCACRSLFSSELRSETEGQDRIQRLKRDRPDVVITVSRFEDWLPWDGDGPNPEEEGFVCYTVDVKAKTIRNGVLYEGSDSLGGSYYQPDEALGEVHGYLPQMIDEALAELDKALPTMAA